MFFIGIGLAAGQIIEAAGWTRKLGLIFRPFFKFGNLGNRCGAAFVTAFISGVSANAMLLDFFKDKKITRKQLFLSNFINQLPAYFLHLPTTFFIVIPLTGWAGALYFIITFLAAILRTVFFLLYAHLYLPAPKGEKEVLEIKPPDSSTKSIKYASREIGKKLPPRIINIGIYVVPIYIIVFTLNSMGLFDLARKWMAGYVVTSFIPVESLSIVILSFAAEFTSGFAAAGALLDAGLLTTRQTVLALILGNIIAFPIRALRHQLPRYIGIFSPKTGTQLLIMGQGFRVLSLIVVLLLYYFLI